tara:strand:+ start:237 stop:812 length:576 start_codon:yes stop_codon:yes gene_type:complete
MYKSRKSMREALREAREYRDPVKEDRGFSSQQIKMAYGVLNDPRYKQGNYSGAFKAIEKIAKGLASHPDVANALKRANEELDKDDKETIKPIIKQLQKSVKAHDKQAKQLQKDIADEKDLEETFTLKKYKENERENDHSLNAIMLVKQFGTDKELKDVEDIDKRHKKAGSISQSDLAKRNQISNKYYKRLK